eukprot:1125310-Alexandrium_andersonii.AAC.1
MVYEGVYIRTNEAGPRTGTLAYERACVLACPVKCSCMSPDTCTDMRADVCVEIRWGVNVSMCTRRHPNITTGIIIDIGVGMRARACAQPTI